jgi:hypothetical protein
MAIAAEHADGRNASVSYAATFARLAADVDAACRHAHRTRPFEKNAQVFARDIEPKKARRLVADLEAGGADAVTFILVEERGAEAVQALAEAVL